jgi:hypothetical protein
VSEIILGFFILSILLRIGGQEIMPILRILKVLSFYLNDILRRKIAAIKTLETVGKIKGWLRQSHNFF